MYNNNMPRSNMSRPGVQGVQQGMPPGVQPIVCPPLCRYTDSYIKREVPFIQPLITCNRQHIVDVPKTYYQQITQNVVVPPTQMPYGGMNPFGFGRR